SASMQPSSRPRSRSCSFSACCREHIRPGKWPGSSPRRPCEDPGMFKHALKLIWNRRRTSRLVVVEIAAAFVITFVLTAIAVDLVSNYRRPVGFDYQNVLSVTAQSREVGDGLLGLAALEGSYSGTLEDVLTGLRALPRTETVAPMQA